MKAFRTFKALFAAFLLAAAPLGPVHASSITLLGVGHAAAAGSTVTTINATGAGSQSFGAGTLDIEVWGAGGSAGTNGVSIIWSNGAGAYSKVTLTLATTTTVFYYNGVPGTTTPNTAGQDTWANSVSNAAPTLTTQGALAKGGQAGTSSAAGLGGAAASGVGTTKFSGGNGALLNAGAGPNTPPNYSFPGGAGAGGPTGNGTNAGYPTGGAGNSPGGNGGNGEVLNGSFGTVSAPTSSTAPGASGSVGGNNPSPPGAAGQIVFTFTP